MPSVFAGQGRWWAWEDLNLRPHPYRQSSTERHADRCFPWWSANVEGQVILCNRAAPRGAIAADPSAKERSSSRRRSLPPAYNCPTCTSTDLPTRPPAVHAPALMPTAPDLRHSSISLAVRPEYHQISPRTADGRVAKPPATDAINPSPARRWGYRMARQPRRGGHTCEVSGGLPNPAAGAPGGHHEQSGDQRQDRGRPTDRSGRWRRAGSSGAPTIMSGTAPRPCLPPWRWPPVT